MATFPTITTEIAFGDNPLVVSPTWTNVSADVIGTIQINRPSRSSQLPGLGQFSAGNLTLRLNDKLRNYDPSNTSSVYAPNVIPRRQIRVTATINAYSRVLFRGFIETWPPKRVGLQNAEVTITAQDALAFLANVELEDELFGEELAHERITDMLDLVNWPAALRSIQTGSDQMLISEEESFSGSVGNHLQQIADSELGRLFVDRSGVVTFHSRSYIRDSSSGTTFAYGFGDALAANELPYTGLEPDFSDQDIVNHSVVNLPGWDPGESEDTTSQTKFGKLSFTYDTLLADPLMADHISEVLIWRYKNPRVRYEEMMVKGATMPLPLTADVLWQTLLDLEIGQRLRVRQRHPAGGATNEQYPFIESLSHTIGKQEWETTVGLGAPDPSTDWFIIEDNTYGLLDTGPGVLAY